MMSIRIIVSGGSGFIGTNVIQYYLDQGVDVFNVDIKKPINSSHMNYWNTVDICDGVRLTEFFNDMEPTHVIHLAARTDLRGLTLQDYSANTQGVRNVISAIDSCGSVKKTIFTSSMLVCKVGYRPKCYDDYFPNTFYGESKVISEKIVKESNNLPCAWNIIRPTSIWGPWFGEPYRNFFDLVIDGKYVNIKNKAATKTFGFVENSVNQIDKLLFLQDEIANRRTFYIGDTPPINISEWADEILTVLGRSCALKIPYPLFKVAAICGDLLVKLNLPTPMNSFRLKNMTTNNIINLDDLNEIVGEVPLNRRDGIIKTLDWLRSQGSASNKVL